MSRSGRSVCRMEGWEGFDRLGYRQGEDEEPEFLLQAVITGHPRNSTAVGVVKYNKRTDSHRQNLPLKFRIIEQTVFFKATPEDVYDVLLDPKKHSKFTGSPATTNARKGATFTAWEGYITGKNLELVKGKKIIQEWKTTEWPAGYPVSRLEFTLTQKSGGTELKMMHSKVPEEQVAKYSSGWKTAYWDPLGEYFAEREAPTPAAKKRASRKK
jgi:activator of HSP90 ATPase